MSNQQPRWSTNREGDIYADLGNGRLEQLAYVPNVTTAKRIVRAVNAHEPMLAALWALLESEKVGGPNIAQVREQARAALDIAEGRA